MAAIHHITVVVAVVLLVLVYKELQHLKVEVEGLLKLLDMREIL